MSAIITPSSSTKKVVDQWKSRMISKNFLSGMTKYPIIKDIEIPWRDCLHQIKTENFDKSVILTTPKTFRDWPYGESRPFMVCDKILVLKVYIRIHYNPHLNKYLYSYYVTLENKSLKPTSLFLSRVRIQIRDQVAHEWLSDGIEKNFSKYICYLFDSATQGIEFFPFISEYRESMLAGETIILSDDSLPRANPFEQDVDKLIFRLTFNLHRTHCLQPETECIICFEPLYQFVTSTSCEHKEFCADCYYDLIERNKTTTFFCPICQREGTWRFE